MERRRKVLQLQGSTRAVTPSAPAGSSTIVDGVPAVMRDPNHEYLRTFYAMARAIGGLARPFMPRHALPTIDARVITHATSYTGPTITAACARGSREVGQLRMASCANWNRVVFRELGFFARHASSSTGRFALLFNHWQHNTRGPRGGRFFEGDAFPFSSGSSMKAGIFVSTQRGVHDAWRINSVHLGERVLQGVHRLGSGSSPASVGCGTGLKRRVSGFCLNAAAFEDVL